MKEIIRPFENSLFDSNVKDIGIDMLEFGIDSILQEGLLKDFPLIGNIAKAGQFVYNLYDRNLLRQTLVFIQQFNNNAIDSEKLECYRESIKNNFKKAEKELGRVLIILNKIIDSEKSVILAKLYSAYINQNITWKEFCEFSEINERLFINDIYVSLEIFTRGMNVDKEKIHNFLRLVSIGLLKNDSRFDSDKCGSGLIVSDPIDEVELTKLGERFCGLIK
ncbi:hypothetical protein [Clostridium butyricum]